MCILPFWGDVGIKKWSPLSPRTPKQKNGEHIPPYCIFLIFFEPFFPLHGPKTKLAFPDLKESSNKKVKENKLALKYFFCLNFYFENLIEP